MIKMFIKELMTEFKKPKVHENIETHLLSPILRYIVTYFSPYFFLICLLLVVIVILLLLLIFKSNGKYIQYN